MATASTSSCMAGISVPVPVPLEPMESRSVAVLQPDRTFGSQTHALARLRAGPVRIRYFVEGQVRRLHSVLRPALGQCTTFVLSLTATASRADESLAADVNSELGRLLDVEDVAASWACSKPWSRMWWPWSRFPNPNSAMSRAGCGLRANFFGFACKPALVDGGDQHRPTLGG